MDEARRIEDDLVEKEKDEPKGIEKRKWDGPSGSSKKKKYSNQKRKEGEDKPIYCQSCHSTHKGPCTKESIRCHHCGKLGHPHEDCKSTEQMCFNCRGMGHVAAACTQAKYQPGGENKKREVGKTTARAYNMVANEKEHDDEE
ncbi:zinc finger, CCHC-type, retrotransposon gag domain protein [Tanacetum coccineum]